MKRFLSTTAVLVALTGTAYADGHATGFGAVSVQENDLFASDLIGMRIYNAETEFENDATVAADAETEWDDIGEINDMIVSRDGSVTAVILGIGGFLGIGERDVSVSMDEIRIVRDENDANDFFLVVNTSQEMLEQAPEFERPSAEADMAEADMAETEAEAEVAEAETEATDMETTAEAAADRPVLTRPTVEREGYEEAEMMEVSAMTADDLQGATVYGANDESVGEINTLLMGDDGKVSDAVVDIGGFLGMGEKQVSVSFDELQVLKNVEGDDVRIYIDSTQETLEALPEYEG